MAAQVRNWATARRDAASPVTVWPYRYELLDGLRGVAALVVVMHHVGITSLGHFAVMVFFVISGYCISAAAESCRDRGSQLKIFMMRRLRRIYPPYLLALAFFAISRVIKTSLGGRDDLSHSIVHWLQNLTLTQWLSLLVQPQPMASQNPTLFVAAFWSLNYEEQFYLVIALSLVVSMRARISLAVPVSVLMAAGLGWNAYRPGSWICGIFLEYWAHFALGSLLFFALCKHTSRRVRALFVVTLISLAGLLALQILPWNAARLDAQRAYVELLFAVAVALGLLTLRPWSGACVRSQLWRPFAALGTISYSLYLIHQFNLTLVHSVATAVLPAGAPLPLLDALVLLLHVALASVFWFFCERPFLRTVRIPPMQMIPAA